jgi:streptomycin 6-kinase
MSIDMTLFDPWLERWDLTPDGEAIQGTWACLLPVCRHGEAAMLKVKVTAEEAPGLDLLTWYDGEGAVRVFERGDTAILMQRAIGERSLKAMARAGEDEAALEVLCAAAARMQAPRAAPPPASLVPLADRFEPLRQGSAAHGGVLARCWTEARALLTSPREEAPLHGDLWHDNVRDDAARGWLVIDPKGFFGERTYDYAVMVTNPDFPMIAGDPQRFARRVAHVAGTAGLEPRRLIQCILVDAGLYALWSIRGGHEPIALAVAGMAAGMLDAA